MKQNISHSCKDSIFFQKHANRVNITMAVGLDLVD